jgi:hypothetical protein
MYSDLVLSTSANLNPVSGYLRSDDGVHFTSTGAKYAGYGTFKRLASKLKLTKYKTIGANLLSTWSGTGGVTTGGGSFTGTPPVGWTCTAPASVNVTIAALAPDMIRFTIANVSGSEQQISIFANNNAALTAAISNGDTIQAGFGYQASGMVGVQRISEYIRVNSATIIFAMGRDLTNEPTTTYQQFSGGGQRNTPPITMTSTVTNIEAVISTVVSATTGAIVLDIYNPTLNKLT